VVVFDCEAIFDVEGIDSLLNRFGQSSPFVLLSQFETVGKRWLPLYEKAWAAIQRTKPAQVLSAIQDAFLTKIVAAGYTRLQGNETVGQCIKALRKTLPVTEEQWAASAGVKKSVLRRLRTETFFLRPSVALVLHNMYHNAFGLDHKISGESDIPAATPHFATNFSGLWDLALQKPVSSNRVA